jgi:hypothetical protein
MVSESEQVLVRERRCSRLTLPACSVCQQPTTEVVLRTEYVLYVRCPRCGGMLILDKPGGRNTR